MASKFLAVFLLFAVATQGFSLANAGGLQKREDEILEYYMESALAVGNILGSQDLTLSVGKCWSLSLQVLTEMKKQVLLYISFRSEHLVTVAKLVKCAFQSDVEAVYTCGVNSLYQYKENSKFIKLKIDESKNRLKEAISALPTCLKEQQ